MQSDAIRNRARADLVVITEQGMEDLFLWEHSERVAENAAHIVRFPGVQEARPDELAVFAAALYHDAGWIARLKENEASRLEILIRPTTEAHREQGALMMERSLGSILPPESLERASRAIRTLNDRDIDTIEGKVVTEADNLDEFGILFLWSTIRRGALDGKGVLSLLETWRRFKDFHFWDARLRNSLRFDRTRQVAMQRLERLGLFLDDLELQQQSTDLG